MEASQQLPDGRIRHRNLPLSEKLLAGESWQDAVPRAVQEELGTVLRNPFLMVSHMLSASTNMTACRS